MFARELIQDGMDSANTLVAGRNVKTVWKPGEKPRWEPKSDVVYMPTIQDNVTFEVHKIAAGLFDHEMLHARHTSTRGMPDESKIEPELFKVFNFIEDARIERIGHKAEPGIRDNLLYLRRWSAKTFDRDSFDSMSELKMALYSCLYLAVGVSFGIPDKAKTVRKAIKKTFMRGALGEVSFDAFRAAEEIMKLVDDEKKVENDFEYNSKMRLQEEKGEEEGNSICRDGAVDEEDEGDNEHEEEEDEKDSEECENGEQMNEDDGQGSVEENDDSDLEEGQNGEEERGWFREEESWEEQQGTEVRTAKFFDGDDSDDSLGMCKQFVVASSDTRSFERYVADVSNDKVKLAEEPIHAEFLYRQISFRMNNRIAVARRNFRTALKALSIDHVVCGRRHGKPITSRYYATSFGNRDICSNKVVGSEIKAAVTIVIDQSLSQRGNVDAIKRLIVCLGECLDGISRETKNRLPFEIMGASTESYPNQLEDQETGIVYDRRIPITVLFYKTFVESFLASRSRLMGIRVSNHWIDGEVIAMAGLRQEMFYGGVGWRRVIVVVTDGVTEGSHEKRHVLISHLTSTIKRLRERGMEVYAVSIKSPYVADLYGEKNVCITSSKGIDGGEKNDPFERIAGFLLRRT